MSTTTDNTLYIQYYNDLIDFNVINNYYKDYLNHILKHKQMVYLAWIYVADKLHELGFINEFDIENIHINIINHDNSKLLRDEFFPYGKRFNSPKKNNPIVKTKFKEAVKLHKERNLHHFEALKNYSGDNWKHFAIELICDYIAMGWEFNDYICEYFNKVKDTLTANLPIEYYNYIENIINIIPDKFPLAEEELSEDNIEYIYYSFNNQNDPFERELITK